MNKQPKVICRFSCGAASAVATKLAISKYRDTHEILIAYNDTGTEHPDNKRFLSDCEKWFGMPVWTLKSEKFTDIYAVFKARRFLVSPKGAPCTSELKRIPGDSIWNFGDIEVFGYTYGEEDRVNRFKGDNDERIIETPLIDLQITKPQCFELIKQAGIELPMMYKLGFRNNNCLGCVKAKDAVNYWKRVRMHFPDNFNKLSALEREFNFAINRKWIGKGDSRKRVPLFLDEIPPGPPKGKDEVKISCGMFCSTDKANE